ncbi:bifunctional DNA-binding transcriptional regulator/O6-methylguanine-DNA methyltransferase Ada [Pseudescherichia vulneris]|uniref:bifunctional DNA-binding transcriptional regulator/O6-methylguanine-DNA methyltransferase Ada n=1 Tax=Pseudescherichia vulneris TaxID=566 RepID=UPI001EDF6953|nr:bifunctional DNA-binding transcriptional regulator/O6-methylguanine-DNA methyltransferase Ada [Pseudescherichia vulneris]
MSVTTFIEDEQRWQAVLERRADADDLFVFAVMTTGIFCRPSCRARHALRENVRFFADAQTATQAGFRPCKRCQPDRPADKRSLAQKITAACRLLEQETPITLAVLAQRVGLSPYHLHRQFKAVTGMTPKAWQQAARAKRLRNVLAHSTTITDAVLAAGFPDSGSYYRKADASLGMTARQYRQGGEGAAIRYALTHSTLGRCLVAESERGICAILLADCDSLLTAELHTMFPQAQLMQDDADFSARVAEVIATIESPGRPLALPLDLRGTAFQMQVWQALQAIPAGETASYRAVASAIGKPQAIRAVASACAANRLAIVIPCHRVVRGDGILSGYRWGPARKAQLLARESLKEES